MDSYRTPPPPPSLALLTTSPINACLVLNIEAAEILFFVTWCDAIRHGRSKQAIGRRRKEYLLNQISSCWGCIFSVMSLEPISSPQTNYKRHSSS